MRLRNHILSILNSDQDFFSTSSVYFDETVKNIQLAVEPVIYSVIYAVNIQCVINGRMEEICRIAKECTSVSISSRQFATNSPMTLKGNGANSELFENRLSAVIDIIARSCGLKTRSVNRLFSLLTPVILSDLYFNYRANNYTKAQLTAHIRSMSRDGKGLSWEVKNELNALTRENTSRRKANTSQQKPRAFGRAFNTVSKKIFRNISGGSTKA